MSLLLGGDLFKDTLLRDRDWEDSLALGETSITSWQQNERSTTALIKKYLFVSNRGAPLIRVFEAQSHFYINAIHSKEEIVT